MQGKLLPIGPSDVSEARSNERMRRERDAPARFRYVRLREVAAQYTSCPGYAKHRGGGCKRLLCPNLGIAAAHYKKEENQSEG
jgi:hypothetical protein